MKINYQNEKNCLTKLYNIRRKMAIIYDNENDKKTTKSAINWLIISNKSLIANRGSC